MASFQQEKNITRLQKICYSKVPHKSRLSAENALDQMTRLPNSVKLVIYSCPVCKFLHIGKQNDYLIKKLKENEDFKQSLLPNLGDIVNSDRDSGLTMEE